MNVCVCVCNRTKCRVSARFHKQVTVVQMVSFFFTGGGRRVVLAAARAGARGIGLDINPGLIRAAKARAKTERLDHLVQFQVAP